MRKRIDGEVQEGNSLESVRSITAGAFVPFLLFLGLVSGMPRERSDSGTAAREKSMIEISVDKYIQPFIRAGGFSGAVLMARDGRILLAKGYGTANIELNVSNTPQTKFQIASLSKSFTAAAMMMLEERWKLRI
jgi:D-alanyl-D-alanine carboxypeptidase